VMVKLESQDVLHDFFLPHLRIKQDAVPGLTIPFWFRPTKLSADRQPVPNRDGVPQKLKYWDIVCAELCGIGHTTMRAIVVVESEAKYQAWLKQQTTEVPDDLLLTTDQALEKQKQQQEQSGGIEGSGVKEQ